jgi:hypothetical protein
MDHVEGPPTRKPRVDAQAILRLITFLDGFAANNFDDYSKFDRMAQEGRLGPRVSAQWREIKPILDQISTSLTKVPRLKLLLRVQLLSKVSGLLLILIAISLFMWQPVAFTIVTIVEIILLYVGIAMLLVPTLVGRRIASTIDDYFFSHNEELGLPRRQLRAHIQRLIQVVRKIAIEQKIPADKFALALYNVDYKGIASIERGRLSKKYWALLDLGSHAEHSKRGKRF